MKLMKTMVMIAVVCTIGWASMQVGDAQDNTAREARDRAEIEALMWRYARALDTSNADAYAAVYAPDGQFGNGPNATKGRAALKKMIADGADRQKAAQAKGEAPRPPMYHMTANQRVSFTDKDHARVEAYYLTAMAAGGENQPLRVAAVGRSIDDVVRVNGQWLIESRDAAPRD